MMSVAIFPFHPRSVQYVERERCRDVKSCVSTLELRRHHVPAFDSGQIARRQSYVLGAVVGAADDNQFLASPANIKLPARQIARIVCTQLSVPPGRGGRPGIPEYGKFSSFPISRFTDRADWRRASRGNSSLIF